ncbi:MAG: phage tail tape measure protein [Acidaminococcus intestini]|uniref:phage tail tape measure protein n=1 Tax=Acidaminococcus intestini TaxID=187327 RepID=UPI0003FA5E6F|nr:phage tail tape measure protein [Acidaminococcus intestini]MBS6986089.1 phage tail tape measure protein [Acidaminococcus intestini]
MARVIDAIIRLHDQFSPVLKKVSNSLTESEKMTNRFGRNLKSIGGTMSSVGATVSTAMAPIMAAAAAGLKLHSDFERGMAKVSTLVDTNVVSLQQLSNGIRQISDETGMSVTELAEAEYQAISASVDTAHVTDFVRTAAIAAKAGFTDTTTAIDGLTTVLNSYGLSAENAGKITDQMLMTQNLGKTTFGDLAQGIGSVATAASLAKVSTDDLFASMAILTKNGVQTSEAFTGFQGILSAVSKQSQQTVKTAAAMGIDFTPEHLGQVGWIQFLTEVKEKVGDDQTAIQHLFGRVEAANAFKVLTKDLGQLKDAQRAMGDSMGATELAFNKMLTPAEKNKIAMNQMKNALMDLRGVVAPVVMATAQAVKSFTSWWNGLSDGQKAFAVHAIQVVAAFGAITLGVGKSISAVGRFSIFINRLPRTFRNIRSAASIIGKGFRVIPGALRLVGGGFLRMAGIVKTAMSGIAAAVAANPVFFALTALVMLLVVVYNHWDEIVSYVKENFPQVYAVVTSVVSNVMSKLSALIDWITGTLIPMWTNGWNTMKAIFEGAFDGISTIAHRALDWILDKVESIKSAVSSIHLPSFSLGGHATGTMGLPGGTTFIHEQGPEIMDLPTGTRIIPHSESLKQEYARGRKEGSGKGGMSITIPKLADQIVVREDADVDRIMEKLVFKLKQFSINRMEGAI